jgi:hypothetical protein
LGYESVLVQAYTISIALTQQAQGAQATTRARPDKTRHNLHLTEALSSLSTVLTVNPAFLRLSYPTALDPTCSLLAITDSSPLSVRFTPPAAPTMSPTSTLPLSRSKPPGWAESSAPRSTYSCVARGNLGSRRLDSAGQRASSNKAATSSRAPETCWSGAQIGYRRT